MNRMPRLSKSGIEYLDYVWNFESGCTNGCEYCYAQKIAHRFPGHYPNGFKPTIYPEALLSPLYLKKPSIIGVAYMGDLLDSAIDPDKRILLPEYRSGWIDTVSLKSLVFQVIDSCPQHTFLFLTKQPQNLIKWSPFPQNTYVGVTATNQRRLVTALSSDGLAFIEAGVKYVSIEPLLERMGSIADYLYCVDWLIIGGKSGKDKFYPPEEWIQEIEGAADKAKIPVFEKDNLRKVWDKPPRHEMP